MHSTCPTNAGKACWLVAKEKTPKCASRRARRKCHAKPNDIPAILPVIQCSYQGTRAARYFFYRDYRSLLRIQLKHKNLTVGLIRMHPTS